MSNIAIKSMDDYMMSLSINTRKEKVRDFLRFMDTSNFFEFDEADEILETKNAWAGYAYLIMLERINRMEISEREEIFLEKYFGSYLLTTKPVGLENELKGFYLKHRISQRFEEMLDERDYELLNEISLEEFRISIEALINEIYGSELELVAVRDSRIIVGNKFFLAKNSNELMIDESYLKDIYNTYLHDKFDSVHVFELLNELTRYIELKELNEVKRHDISKKAVIYTAEDYLESKANRKNRLGEIYKDLYQDIIANKQIFIDASTSAYEKLEALEKKLETSSYPKVDEAFKEYLTASKKNLDEMIHYYGDARFFDTTNLEKDAFSKIFNMYINGLKAMPKTQLTDVTKYFVINGNPLTTLDMDAVITKMDNKIRREKNEEKRAKLVEKLNDINTVMEFVEAQSYSYALEHKIRKYVNSKLCADEDLINDAKEHYADLLVLENRLKNAIVSNQQLASSSSASKVSNIMEKNDKLTSMLFMCVSIRNEISSEIPVDFDRDIVVKKVNNESKALAMLQELTGKNLFDCELDLDNSQSYGEPVMVDLNPGFKHFATKALRLKGVKEFKTK